MSQIPITPVTSERTDRVIKIAKSQRPRTVSRDDPRPALYSVSNSTGSDGRELPLNADYNSQPNHVDVLA